MRRSKERLVLLSMGILAVFGLMGAAIPFEARAQARPTAVFTKVQGTVEILPVGQTNWIRAAVGARVGENDEVRATAGANGELALPDRSTLVVAENTRFKVTKLDYDAANRPREAVFHLAVGKLRAAIAKISIALVQARTAHFGITTPTAVAAVRGTTLIVTFDPGTGATSFFVSEGTAVIRVIQAVGPPITVTVTAGQTVSVPTRGAPPTPVTSYTPAQLAAAQSNAQTVSPQGATVITQPTIVVTPPDQVLTVIVPPEIIAPVVVLPPQPKVTQQTPFSP